MTEGKLSEGRSSGRETIVSRRLCLIGGQLEKGIVRERDFQLEVSLERVSLEKEIII